MSVTAVRAFANTQGGCDAEGTHTYTNVYHVYTNDKDDGSDTARGSAAVSAGLPDYNATWAWGNDSNAYALAKTRQAELAEVSTSTPYYKKWNVTIGYTTAGQSRDSSGGGGSGSGSSEGVQDSVDEQWKISGSYVQTTESTSLDKDGKRIQNTAEQAYPVDVPSGYDSIVTSGNTNTISLLTRSSAVAKCNSTAMWGLAIRQVYLAQWSYDILYRGTTAYVAHRLEWWIAKPYDIATKRGLWNFTFNNVGTRFLVDPASTDPDTRYQVVTARDSPIGVVMLDLTGRKLDPVAFPNGINLAKEVIEEYDFIANLTFLTDPLPGPFA